MTPEPADSALLDQLGRLSTCIVASTIETFGVRLRNTGFANSSIRCMFDDLPPVVGYAATARIRGSQPPMGGRTYYDRTDWWNYLLTIPAPRIVVIEDMDRPSGLGSLVGEVHANILRALGCVAFATNGAVRELPALHRIGIQCFAGNVAVSHSYAHIFEFGTAVEIGGLRVEPGDLLHGDRHGVLQIPGKVAGEVPGAARKIIEKEQGIIALCQSNGFSLEKLIQLIRSLNSPQNPAPHGTEGKRGENS
ncbi:MAG: RraA family protein [Candidatus Acidiferrales bacterium]